MYSIGAVKKSIWKIKFDIFGEIIFESKLHLNLEEKEASWLTKGMQNTKGSSLFRFSKCKQIIRLLEGFITYKIVNKSKQSLLFLKLSCFFQRAIYINNRQCLLPYTECVTDLDKMDLVKFGYGGLAQGSSQSMLLPKLARKMMHASKVVKFDTKIITSPHFSKSVTHTLFVY